MSDEWTSINRGIIDCELCPRLRGHCAAVGREKRAAYQDWTYWAKPVPNFGAATARLLIVGLAPGAHGANRTGRMFTGDRSGDWLYRALHRAGFANQANSESLTDGLHLIDCAITAVCHCAPPDNKPTGDERAACQGWLEQTFTAVPASVYLALGGIAWDATWRILARHSNLPRPKVRFAHGQQVPIADGGWLFGCYHPSQQNTFTGRLTETMFDQVFERIRHRLTSPPVQPRA